MEWELFQAKMTKWREYAGNGRLYRIPPLFKALWKLKIPIKPPHYINPFVLACVTSVLAGIGIYVALYFVSPRTTWENRWLYVCVGIAAGVFHASWLAAERRVRKLPKWEDL